MFTKIVIVTSYLKNDSGRIGTETGAGFIINGEYLATCYHVYQPPSEKKPIRVKVDYNFRQDGNQLISDSVDVDLDYKYTDNQYDFSKHKYIDKDYTTDFIILKLKKDISYSEFIYNTDTNLPKYTLMPCIAFDHTVNAIRNDNLTYLYAEFRSNDKNAYLLTFFGVAKEGFSGCPVYNNKEEIVGIIQSGDNKFQPEKMKALQSANFLSQEDINGISNGYKDGQSISYAMNIKYLLDRYISYFLK